MSLMIFQEGLFIDLSATANLEPGNNLSRQNYYNKNLRKCSQIVRRNLFKIMKRYRRRWSQERHASSRDER